MLKQPSIQLAIASIIFGLGAVFVVFIDLSATVIAFYRLFIGAILFAGLLIYKRESFSIAPDSLLFACLAGAFLGMDLAMWNTGIQLVGPGVATILNSLQVFCMAVFGWVIYRDKPSALLWLSLFATFFGVVLLSHHEIQSAPTGLSGVVISIISGVAFAASMLCLREASKRQAHSLLSMMFYASIAGALATGVYAVLAGSDFIAKDSLSWVMLFIYGSVVHVFAWFMMAKSLPHVSVAATGLLMCLEAVMIFFIDLGLLGKSITWWQTLGAALTITAIYFGSQAGKKKD